MCGITGVYGTSLGSQEHTAFRRLLDVNVYRGSHSTGIVKISKGKNRVKIDSVKSLLPASVFNFSEDGQKFIGYNTKNHVHGFIGHTRHATVGDVTIKNAHPFGFDTVIGVHNGTIDHPFEGSDLYGTDSEALYRLINDKGIEEALRTVAGKSPAYALVWVDKKKNTLNFVRNSKRTLYFTYLYNRSTIVWSSLREDLEYILDKLNFTTYGWPTHSDDDKIFTINPNEHMEITIGDTPRNAVITKLDVPVYATRYYTPYSHGEYYSDWWETHAEKAPAKRQETNGSLIHLPWLNTEPSKNRSAKNPGEPESEQELAFRLSEGCFSCGEGIALNDHAERARVAWWDREFFACGDCYEDKNGDRDWVWRSIHNDWSSETRPESLVDKTA